MIGQRGRGEKGPTWSRFVLPHKTIEREGRTCREFENVVADVQRVVESS